MRRWTRPISPARPAGERVSYDPEFDVLKREVAKLESVSGGEVDWERVAAQADRLLAARSKDLLVASYGAFALYKLEGLPGLDVGLRAITGLLRDYWATMFPPKKRLRGRVGALQWLLTQVERALQSDSPRGVTRADVARVQASARAFVRATRERLGDRAPASRPLLDGLDRVRLSLPEEPAASPRRRPPPRAATRPRPNPPVVSAPTPAGPKPATTDPTRELKARAKPWMTAIPGPSPAGEDLKYDPEYVAIRDEISKLESVSGGAVDWERVEAGCDALLRTRTKDLLLACYFARARFASAGLDGLVTGLVTVTALSETYWSVMHPPLKRIRRRGNAIEWLLEQVVTPLQQHAPTDGDRDVVAALERAAKAFAAEIRARLKARTPAVRPLLGAIERIRVSLPPPPSTSRSTPTPAETRSTRAPAAAETPSAPRVADSAASERPTAPDETPAPSSDASPPDAASAQRPAPVAPPTPTPRRSTPAPHAVQRKPLAPLPTAPKKLPKTPAEATRFLGELGTTLTRTASMLRAADRSAPAAYRLLRVGLYLHMDQAPPAVDGKTQIPPLPTPLRDKLERMRANAKWGALLEESEESLRRFRFALDLHALSSEALAGLKHAAARDGLLAALAATLRRMPTLAELRAQDGSPLAAPSTRAWMREAVQVSRGSAEAKPSTAEGERSSSPGDALIERVRKTLHAGSLRDAVREFAAHSAALPSARERFAAGVGLAELSSSLDAAGRRFARGLLRGLELETRHLALDSWDPELARRCLAGLAELQAGSRQANPPDEALARLCLLDPSRALALLSTPTA